MKKILLPTVALCALLTLCACDASVESSSSAASSSSSSTSSSSSLSSSSSSLTSSSEKSSSSEQSSSSSAESSEENDEMIGKTLFEALALKGGENCKPFAEAFDENNFTSANYHFYGIAPKVYHTANTELVKKLYEALRAVKLESAVPSGEIADDAGELFEFIGKDGRTVYFSFELERASVGGKKYECSGLSALRKIRDEIIYAQAAEGMNALEAYSAVYGGKYEEFSKDYMKRILKKADILIFGEAYEEYSTEDAELIARLYDALQSVCLTELFEGAESTDSAETFIFTDEDGEEYSFTFDAGCLSVNDALYKCDKTAALQSAKKAVMAANE